MNRTFRPPLWAWLFVGTACVLTAGLGFWQCQRGAQKQSLLDALATAATQAAMPLRRDSMAGSLPVRAEAHGHYDIVFQLLLDNQTHEHRPGYHVWTPFRLDSGGVILVNRGWLPANPDRSILPALPAPANEPLVRGLWRSLPEAGLRLSSVANCPEQKKFPAVVSYPDAADLHCLLGQDVIPGVLLLDADVAGGFVRDWQTAFVGFPPSRHYAYAAQWFALCATLLFLFVRFNFKKTGD